MAAAAKRLDVVVDVQQPSQRAPKRSPPKAAITAPKTKPAATAAKAATKSAAPAKRRDPDLGFAVGDDDELGGFDDAAPPVARGGSTSPSVVSRPVKPAASAPSAVASTSQDDGDDVGAGSGVPDADDDVDDDDDGGGRAAASSASSHTAAVMAAVTAAAASPKRTATKAASKPPVSALTDDRSSGANVPAGALANFDWQKHTDINRLLTDNRQLSAELAQKTAENEQLADALVTLRDELQATADANPLAAASKEMAKKNRQLSVQLNKERGQLAAALNEIERLKTELALAAEGKSSTSASAGAGAAPGTAGGSKQKPAVAFGSVVDPAAGDAAAAGTVEEWREKYTTANKRLIETRAALDNAQKEITKARTALQKEVGLDVPLARVLDDSGLGKWRGRAQQIEVLKAKLREARKPQPPSAAVLMAAAAAATGGNAIHYVNNDATVGVPFSPPSPTHGQQPPGSAGGSAGGSAANAVRKLNVHERHEQRLKDMSANQKIEADRQAEANAALRADLTAVRQKLSAVDSRNRTLEADAKSVRERVRKFADKSKADDQLIDALKQELSRLRDAASATKRTQAAAQQQQRDAVVSDAARRQLEQQLSEQKKTIASLHDQVRQLQRVRAQAVSAGAQDFDRAERDAHVQQLQSQQAALTQLLTVYELKLKDLQGVLTGAATNAVSAASGSGGAASAKKGGAAGTGAAAGAGAAAKRVSATAHATKRTGPGAAAAAAEDVAALRKAADAAAGERAGFATTLAAKEEQIRLLQTMLTQNTAQYHAAIQVLRDKLTALQQTVDG